jgi:hypothetical protein
MRLIPPTTPLPADLAGAVVPGESLIEPEARPWVLLPMLLSGTLLVCLAVLALVALAWAILR